jgi:hypothetical protein
MVLALGTREPAVKTDSQLIAWSETRSVPISAQTNCVPRGESIEKCSQTTLSIC